jgi:anti-sigma regulatory factor (Ser/Thr protein kinase)
MGVTVESRVVEINRSLDVLVARENARLMAAAAGFDRYACTEIETAVSELGTNVLRYGVRGRAFLRTNPEGFEVEVLDEGPGFGAAPTHSSGLGIGLDGAGRLMDELSIENRPEGGRVLAKKAGPWRQLSGSKWVAAAAMATVDGETVGGDAYLVKEQGRCLLVAVVDGLGHGDAAATAAAQVIAHFQERSQDPVDVLLVGAHTSARSTRGAVAIVARIDPEAERLTYAGVGDVSGLLLSTGERLIPHNGCLGVRVPTIQSRDLTWRSGSMLVLWTDGLHLSAPLPTPEPTRGAFQEWAEQLLIEDRTGHDDALVLAIGGA